MECLDIVPGISQMPQGTARPGSSHMWLGPGKPQSTMSIPCLVPATEPDSSLIQIGQPVELVSFDPCICGPRQITIYISDSDEEMVTAPASADESRRKLVFLTSYLWEMQYVSILLCVSCLLISVTKL
jgi:hypothetical protein